MLFRAAIFDLDGTILDTIEDLADAMNYALRLNHYPERSLDFIRLAVGNGMRELTRKSLPAAVQSDAQRIDLCCRQMKSYYLSHWNLKTRPYDGIRELFLFCKEQNIAVSVLSNKADEATKAMVPYWYGDLPFAYIWGEQPGFARKPDPASALEIARLLGISPKEVLFVGDSSYDMITAKNAGMFAAGVLWGFRTEEELRASGADFIAKTPQDLIAFIRSAK